MLAKLRPWIGAACVAAPIVALVVVAAGQAQPPNFPRMPGMPGMPGGRMPGIPAMPAMPSIPTMPSMPSMPGGGGFGGMPEYVYTCSGCRREIARSPSPITPNFANCPYCGVRFGNTMAGNAASMQERMMGAGGGWNNPSAVPQNPNTAGPANPQIVNPPDPPENDPPAAAPPVFTPPVPFNTTPAPVSAAPSKGGAGAVIIWVLVGIIAMLIFVALLGGAIWLISTAPSLSASPAPRPRRRRPQPPIIHP